jgi:predicted Zn-dependent protease
MLMQSSGLMRQRTGVKRKRRMVRMLTFGVLGGLVSALVMLYVCRDAMVKTAARAVPVELEVQLGDKLFEQMMLSEHLVTDEEISARLAMITDPLVAGISDKRHPLKFHIVENATLNAFAMPGGNVILHSGLLLKAGSPEEVAGVLAHEIAHVQQRHGIRGILSSAGLFMIVQSLLGDVTGLVAVLTDNGSFLLSRRFSRDFEREADDCGWAYLLAADIRPEGMIRFFQRMREEEKLMLEKLKDVVPVEVDGGALQLASTHPATGERIDALQSKLKDLPANKKFRTFDLNFADFQNRLRARLHTSAQEPERAE